MKANKPARCRRRLCQAPSGSTRSKSGILPIWLGQALIATGDPASLKKAIDESPQGLERDNENSSGYRFLAQAYGQLGDIPQADLATAEGHFYQGTYQDAQIFAARAQQKLKRGEPGWVRAQDIINYKIAKKKA